MNPAGAPVSTERADRGGPRSRDRRLAASVAAYALVCAGYLMLIRWAFPRVPIVFPDTQDYLYYFQGDTYAKAVRTIAYPAFLWLAQRLHPDLYFVAVLQLVLFVAAVAYLSRAVGALTGSAWAGRFTAISILSMCGWILLVTFTILSESLFVSLLLVHLGAGLTLLQRGSLRTCIWFGVTGALALLTRPIPSMVVVDAALLAVVVARRRSLRELVGAVAPAALLVGAASAYNYSTACFPELTVFGSVNVTNVVLPLLPSVRGSARQPLVDELVRASAGYLRELQAAPSPYDAMYTKMVRANDNIVRTRRHIDDYLTAHPEMVPAGRASCAGTLWFKAENKLRGEIVRSAVAADPLGFLGQVLENLRAFYASNLSGLAALPTPRGDELLSAYFAPGYERPYLTLYFGKVRLDRYDALVSEKPGLATELGFTRERFVRDHPIFRGAGWDRLFAVSRVVHEGKAAVPWIVLGAFAIPLALLSSRRVRAPAAGALYLSANVVLYSIAICTLTFPFDRYVYILQPLIAASIVLSASVLVSFVRARLAPWPAGDLERPGPPANGA